MAQERPTYTIERPLLRFRATVCPLVHANERVRYRTWYVVAERRNSSNSL